MKNKANIQNLSDFDNKKLLIVEDNNPFRERLARSMEKKGFLNNLKTFFLLNFFEGAF